MEPAPVQVRKEKVNAPSPMNAPKSNRVKQSDHCSLHINCSGESVASHAACSRACRSRWGSTGSSLGAHLPREVQGHSQNNVGQPLESEQRFRLRSHERRTWRSFKTATTSCTSLSLSIDRRHRNEFSARRILISLLSPCFAQRTICVISIGRVFIAFMMAMPGLQFSSRTCKLLLDPFARNLISPDNTVM